MLGSWFVPEDPCRHSEGHLSRHVGLAFPYQSTALLPKVPLVRVMSSTDSFGRRAGPNQEEAPSELLPGEGWGPFGPKVLVNEPPRLPSFPESDKGGFAWWAELW